MRTGRVLLVGLIFLVLANLWVRQGELLTLAAQVSMAVPPVPALVTLLVLLAGLGIIRKVGIGRKEVMGVYMFLTLAVALTSGAAMRFFLPALVTPFYFASEENRYSEIFKFIPSWATPHGDEVIRQYFEGSDLASSGLNVWLLGVPWGAWLQPLAIWLVFFVGFYTLLLCLAMIFQPVWEEGEHLSYPMSEFSLLLAGYRQGRVQGVWTNPIFWIGVAVVGIADLSNILNAFNPGLPAIGLATSLDPLFAEHPLTALRPLTINYRPAILGIAYMMPSDIVISTLVLYFGYLKGLSLTGAMAGFDIPGYPFDYPQAMGGFVALAVVLIYGARKRFADVFGALAGRGNESPWLAIGVIVSTVIVFGFWLIFGMKLWVLAVYLILVLSHSIGYMRIRAETGYPTWWIKPLNQERDMLISFFGTARMSAGGKFGSLAGLEVQNWMYRGYFGQFISYQAEALRIGGEIKVDRKQIVSLMIWAVILGTVVSWWMHLSTAYELGANVLEGGATQGGTRVALMTQAYDQLASWMRGPVEPQRNQTIAFFAGSVMVILLVVLRRLFLQFPLHPSGFVMALTGGASIGWASLLLALIVKSITLRLGGMRLYNRLLPFFIGIVVGHYFWSGTVWAFMASFGGEGFNKLPVGF
ncbi:MAG TPA: hypothetical protein DEP45_12945 [Armatimonadetes bacterium]|nr:hypothetical protein [Armatimonadota bacterium]